MRTCGKICKFKAFLTSKVLSFECSVSETGNIGSHKSRRGCRSSFHLLSGSFPITLSSVQLSRPRSFFLLGLGEKTLLHVKCFAICQNNNFQPIRCQTSLLFNDFWGYISLQEEENSRDLFPNFCFLQPITILSLLILWAVVHQWFCHQRTT